MRIDFTLTLPGLWEIPHICTLAREYNVDILAKVVFAFSPDIAMSPLFLPRKLLERSVNEILLTHGVDNRTIREMLKGLLERPTFEEQFPDTYQKARTEGKWRMNALDKLRGGMTFANTLQRQDVQDWYNEIY